MNSWSKGWMLGAAALMVTVAAGCSGCQFQAAQEGERGNLEFVYTAADGDTTFERPLAVGSGLRVNVEPLGGRSLDYVTAVTSSDSSVIAAEVETGASDAIYLVGRAGGHAEIEVEARGGGETYSDRILMSADWVDQVGLSHSCTAGTDAAYLADYDATILLDRRNDRGQKLVGTAASQSLDDAHLGCQLEIYPADEQQRPYCDTAGLHFPEFLDYGEVELFPIDEVGLTSGSHPALGVHAVSAERISLEQFPRDEARVDRTRSIELEAYWEDPGNAHGPGGSTDWPVCTHMAMDIEVRTPDICTGRSGSTSFSIDSSDENEIDIRGVRRGSCQLDIYVLDEFGEVGPFPVDVEVVD